MSEFEARAVAPAAVRPLRRALLRPTQAAEALVYAGDDDADALHVAGFVDDEMVGIASICREPYAGAPAFRLRGMGTVAAVRGRGFGRALLQRCLDHAVAQGVSTVWCNARVSAIGFYERAGFVTVGERFELPDIGPHVVMVWRSADD